MINTNEWIAFRECFEKCDSNKKSQLMKYMSDDALDKMRHDSSTSSDPFSHFLPLESRLSFIHYSWLIPFIEPFCQTDQAMIIHSLPSDQSQKLEAFFDLPSPQKTYGNHVQTFFRNKTYDWLTKKQKNLLPLEYLPKHPLTPLLFLKKSELIHLIDLLSLHDLAAEMHHVIYASQIKKIYSMLSPTQQRYLKKRLEKKEPVSFARLNLDRWDGSEDTLKKILHHRGLNRLAKALFGCHPSLFWHFCHKLDTGRTKTIKKFFTDMNNERAQDALIKQVSELMTMIEEREL